MSPTITAAVPVSFALSVVGGAPWASLPPGPEPTPTRLTITMNGKVIELVPGENLLPETSETLKAPEILKRSGWVLVDVCWDFMPKGVGLPLEVESLPEADGQHPFPAFPENWES